MKAIFKLVKIVLAVLLALVIIVLIALVIFVKTFDANKYKPQIVQAATQALGRQADIRDISLSLSLGKGLGLQLKSLTIADDPAFGKDNFFILPQINAAVDVMTFVKERRIAVSSIVLNAPKVIVIRDNAGKLNMQTIGAKPVTAPAASIQPAVAAPAMPPLVVKSFKITDATIIFKDNTFNPPLACTVEHVNIEVKDFSLDKWFSGSPVLIKLTGGLVKTTQLAQAVSSINAILSMTDKDLTIDNFSAALAKGTISVKGAVKDYPAAKNIELELAVKDLELNDALEQSKAQIKIAGVVNFNFKAQGSLGDLKSIKGDGTLEIKPATLKDLNILKSVLDKITFIPGLSDMVINSLGNDKYSQELKSPDTQINRVGLTIKVEQGAANIDPLTIETDMFNFNGKAAAGFDQSYDVDGNIAIAQDLSAQMAKGVKEMSYLFDDKNCIAIPVDVKGKGSEKPEIKVSETTAKLLKNAAINKGAEMLGNMLNKYVGGSGDASGNSNSSGAGDAIKGLLNKFLSK